MAGVQVRMDSWFVQHLSALKTTMRVIFGVVWGIDGALKFQPGLAASMTALINSAAQEQPAWLAPWFNFWGQTVSANSTFYVYLVGILELALSFALILGFLRKIAYTGGLLLSFFIWSVPEGFGGPYGPGSTDIGTGIVYAFVFVFLMIVNATFGPSRFSLDFFIEKRFPGWRRLSEIRSDRVEKT